MRRKDRKAIAAQSMACQQNGEISIPMDSGRPGGRIGRAMDRNLGCILDRILKNAILRLEEKKNER